MRYAFAQLLPALLLCEAALAQLEYRPNREQRSLNTGAYELSIQKNGEVDVSLASGEPVFTDAFPMVWFESDPKPRPMTIDGDWSQRFATSDPLGDGHGMMLRKKECTWSLRAYPAKPYFAVQAAYENTGRKTVRVRALMPWCVGEPRKGWLRLGSGATGVVQRDAAIALPNRDPRGEYLGARNVALYDSRSGRSLIAGFLTQHADHAVLDVDALQNGEYDGFDRVRFACYFDPPVAVEPGETLESDVLYLGVVETDPVTGLERFVRAVEAVNRVVLGRDAPAHYWLEAGTPQRLFDDLVRPSSKTRARPPRPLDLFSHTPFRTWLWIDRSDTSPRIVATINDSSHSVTRTIRLDRLGADPAAYHHLYDLATDEYIGVARAAVSVEVGAGESRALSIVPRQAHPQAVVWKGHPFEQPAAEWDGSSLSGRISGADGQETIVVVAPDPYRPADSRASGGRVTLESLRGIYALRIDAAPGAEVNWSISFDRDSATR